jgi:ribosomal protein S18 acetylase RimI-like enzyme
MDRHMTPYRAEGPHDWAALLALIRAAFAGMEGRIDPPSSMHALTEAGIADQAATGEVWAISAPPVACVFLTARPGRLYIGKLAVAEAQRGQGFARRLVDQAEARARALGLPVLELQTRVELVENHAAFAAMGFVKVGETAHPGFARPTSFTFQRAVPPAAPAPLP